MKYPYIVPTQLCLVVFIIVLCSKIGGPEIILSTDMAVADPILML